MITFRVSTNASDVAGRLRASGDGIGDRLEAAVAATARILDQELRETVPVSKPVPGGREPGRLRQSIRFDQDGTVAEFEASDTAQFVIGGTAPHVITGNPLLHFWWDKAGGFVTFSSVHHPGTRPNDFRLPALAVTESRADQELARLADWFAGMV